MQRRFLRTAAAAAALALSAAAGTASAQQTFQRGQQWQDQSERQRQMEMQRQFQRQMQQQQPMTQRQPQQAGLRELGLAEPGVGRITSIQGTVTETKEVAIGDRDPYLFGFVEDWQGRERLVNFGPTDQVGDLISEGEQVEVRAVQLPILGRDVYHTVALRADGQTMRVQQIQDPEVRRALREGIRERFEQQRFQQQQPRFQQQQRFQQAGTRQMGMRQTGPGQTGLREIGLGEPGVGRITSIQGTIEETREVSIGEREPYLFAHIRDWQGRERLVNLGPADQVGDLLSEGDQVEVRAVQLPILGRDVYHTVMLRADGQTMRVQQIQDPEVRRALREGIRERFEQQRSQQQQPRFQQTGMRQMGMRQTGPGQTGLREIGLGEPGVGRITSIQGTIEETREVSIGEREPYLFAHIQDWQGRERLVNLGPADQVGDLLSEGDQVEVRAVHLPILGRDVYHAVVLRSNGEIMRVQQIQDPEVRRALREGIRERFEQRFDEGY